MVTSVSCRASNFCIAVDDAGNAFTYNGSWTQPKDIDGTRELTAVSCNSSGFCVAVDNHGNAVIRSGGNWALPQGIDGTTPLWGVSVVSSSFAVAVDEDGNALMYNGSSWSTTDIDGFEELQSASCTSTTFCAVVDVAGHPVGYDADRQLWYACRGRLGAAGCSRQAGRIRSLRRSLRKRKPTRHKNADRHSPCPTCFAHSVSPAFPARNESDESLGVKVYGCLRCAPLRTLSIWSQTNPLKDRYILKKSTRKRMPMRSTRRALYCLSTDASSLHNPARRAFVLAHWRRKRPAFRNLILSKVAAACWRWSRAALKGLSPGAHLNPPTKWNQTHGR